MRVTQFLLKNPQIALERILWGINKKPIFPETTFKLEAPIGFRIENVSLAIHIHCHYKEYVESVAKLVKALEPYTKIFVSVTSDFLSDSLEMLGVISSDRIKISVVTNVGRNFYPLFSVFATDIQKYDFVLHLHSKKSTHSNQVFASEWANLLWTHLDPRKKTFLAALNYLKDNRDVAIFYPSTFNLLPRNNFRFGANAEIADSSLLISSLMGKKVDQRRFSFPAGGMFLAKTEALAPLFDLGLSRDSFPSEEGQKDGTLQHLLERLVGYVPSAKGLRHLVYFPEIDEYSDDTAFVRKGELFC